MFFTFFTLFNIHVSYRGVVYYFKFRLKYYLALAFVCWVGFVVSFVFYMEWVLRDLYLFSSFFVPLLLLAWIPSLVFAIREDERLRFVEKLLRALPLKNRLLLRVPEEITEKPLPKPLPLLPARHKVSFLLIITAAAGQFALTFFPWTLNATIVPSPLVFISPALTSLPVILLPLTIILFYKEKIKAASLLGLIISVLMALTGSCVGVNFGTLGVLGVILSLGRELSLTEKSIASLIIIVACIFFITSVFMPFAILRIYYPFGHYRTLIVEIWSFKGLAKIERHTPGVMPFIETEEWWFTDWWTINWLEYLIFYISRLQFLYILQSTFVFQILTIFSATLALVTLTISKPKSYLPFLSFVFNSLTAACMWYAHIYVFRGDLGGGLWLTFSSNMLFLAAAIMLWKTYRKPAKKLEQDLVEAQPV